MGFWRDLLASYRGGSVHFTPREQYIGAAEVASMLDPAQMTPVRMWESQPHFRTVVSFLARNVAHLGLHVFERSGDDRHRDRTSPLARVISDVDGYMTTYDIMFALVGDIALYDRAYWLVAQSTDATSGWTIRRLPPTWVETVMESPWRVKHYNVLIGPEGQTLKVKPESMLDFSGYHPSRVRGASPTVVALRETLKEQVEAAKYRGQIWKRGGRVSSVLERPANAPPWSDKAREAFREDWYAKYTGTGSYAGGTPLLEDGMKLTRVDFSAQDQQFVEAAKLSMQTVAAAFHVNPTMVGQMDNTNYSNVREFRKMLYGETLGPLLAQIEARINRTLPVILGMDRARYFVEFNIEEKLQGSFEEQSASLQSSTGAPWLTRNEARAIRNLPAISGGDELVVPLNVLVGGQASALDSGTQNVRGAFSQGTKQAVLTKAPPVDAQQERVQQVLADFFKRQGRSVRSRLGAGDDDWWDAERWDGELADDLHRVAMLVSTSIGEETAEAMGFTPGDYDVDRTLSFLRAVSERVAGDINATTLGAIRDGVEGVEGGTVEAADHVFGIAEDSRASAAALTFVTFAAGFATVEAGRQLAGSQATKTWVVNSSNPRASHAAMNGETVPVDENFSNGMPWPGSIEGGADEVAGCQCSLVVNVPD